MRGEYELLAQELDRHASNPDQDLLQRINERVSFLDGLNAPNPALSTLDGADNEQTGDGEAGSGQTISGSNSDNDAIQRADAYIKYVRDQFDQLSQFRLSIGWGRDALVKAFRDDEATTGELLNLLASKIGGLVMTIAALSLGASFWFDTLKQLVSLRASGKQITTTTLE